jgi:hypothetical protein
MSRPTMSPAQVEQVANELRVLLRERTCCPEHAGQVLLHVMAGFCLDDADDDRHRAATKLRRAAKVLADDIAAGRFLVMRTRQ